jgi:hypothetical protein
MPFGLAARSVPSRRSHASRARPIGGLASPAWLTSRGGAVAPVDYTDGGIALCADGTGRIAGIPEAVWSFSVSGYRLVPRWIESRVRLPADLSLVRELRDICSRIAELIRFAEADIVLEVTLGETLPREALGLDGGGQEEDGGPTGPVRA